MKREANFQTRFNNYLKHVHKKTGAFELKQTTGNSLPFSAVEDHQIAALQAVASSTFVFKIPDAGYQNPFDCFSLTSQGAYVVIYFAQSKFFYGISIDRFIDERGRSSRGSLTETRAKDDRHVRSSSVIVSNTLRLHPCTPFP